MAFMLDKSIARIRTPHDKVSIEVEEPHVYYVDGVLAHNKALC